MRLLTIKVPAGQGLRVIQTAFAAGIKQVSTQQVQLHREGQPGVTRDVVEIETPTPLARQFLHQLTSLEEFDKGSWIISGRHPQSLITQEDLSKETRPVVTPALEILEDLWQFSHLSVSLVGRVFLSALLLAYGMIELNLPVMIAGLLFLPYHHQMLATAFGACTRSWRLVGQGLWALMLSTVLIIVAAACVAYLTEPPVKFDKFGSLLTGFFIALIVGAAAALASADDAGRRELIGLAATAHITVLPAWFGISLIFGFPEGHVFVERFMAFCINVAALTFGAFMVFCLLRLRIPAKVLSHGPTAPSRDDFSNL